MADSEVKARLRVIGGNAFRSEMKSASSSMDGLKSAARSAGSTVMRMFSMASTGGSVALLALGTAASKTSGDLEALKLGLQSQLGTAKAAAIEWERLRDIAKMPGLGLEEAAQGVTSLMAAGLGLGTSERALKAFGNALAVVGKGKDDLQGVILALSQIQSKGKVSAEEINQIAERVPQIRKVMQSVFGTADTEVIQKMGLSTDEFINGVIAGLEKIPKVAGGTKNAFENIGDAIKIAMGQAGDVINKYLVPSLNKVSDFLTYLVDNNIIGKIVQGFANMFSMGGKDDALVVALSWVVATLKNLPRIIQNTFSTLEHIFEPAIEIAKLWASMMAVSFSLRVVTGIISVAKAIATVATALRGAAAAGTVLTSLTGAGIAVAAAAVGIGAATYYGLGAMMPKIGNVAGGLVDGGIEADQKRIMEGFSKNSGSVVPGLPGTGVSGFSSGSGMVSSMIDQVANILKAEKNALHNIERHTRQTADNTDKMEELRRFVIGGGERAASALGGYQFGRGRGGGAIKVQVVGSGNNALDVWLSEMFQKYEIQRRRIEGA
jgi:tape measure domain-containing protein